MKKIHSLLLIVLFLSSCATAQEPKLQEDLALKYLVQLPKQKATHAPVIILLHGYGSDEKDLFELRGYFPDKYLIISARAPYPLPERGYEWYTPETVNGMRDGNQAQLTNSRGLITKLISQVVTKYNADPAVVYVMGFSQGAILSYQAGLTSPGKVHGIGALSGMIFPSLKPMIKNTPDLKKVNIFISHGTADQMISYADGKAADDYLTGLGLKPEFHKYEGMGHAISKDVITDLLKWMK